jgi:pectinesterase
VKPFSSLTWAFALLSSLGLAAQSGSLLIKPDLVVAADGSGDFKTVQSALESIPRDNRERRVLYIKNGESIPRSSA